MIKKFWFVLCAVFCLLFGCSGIVFADDEGRQCRYNEAEVFNSWLVDVRVQLSDNDPDCKYMKKLRIFGVPSEFEISDVGISFASDEHRRFGAVWSSKGDCCDSRRYSSELIFNAAEDCYEVDFNPLLSDGHRFDKQVFAENLRLEDCIYVKAWVYRKKGFEDEAYRHNQDVFYAKVSNNGLKNSKIFSDFAGMRVERVEKDGKSFLKFVGVPDGIKEIHVSDVYERAVGSESNFDWPLLYNVIVKRNEVGEFMMSFNPKDNVNHTINFEMKDSDGFFYFFWLDFNV